MKYVQVIVNRNNKNVDHIFTYKNTDIIKDKIQIGMRILVPFGKGNNLIEGYVIGFSNECDISEDLLKSVYSLVDEYVIFNENMIILVKWLADKYYTTLADCFHCVMPKIMKDRTVKYAKINYDLQNINEIIDDIIKKNNPQSKVLKLLKVSNDISVSYIKTFLEVTISPIYTLEKKGIIVIEERESLQNTIDVEKYKKTEKLSLNYEQENAFKFIENKLKNNIFNKPTLLHGVTGSGKTEVYLQIIEKIIDKGQQAIVLIPEISLTTQTVRRFTERFGNLVTVTHSRLSDGERFSQWKKAKNKEISIMIGARSAIFTPFDNLGIIIIDEEHENTYKSEDTPKYDTREVAEKISQITGCELLLGSATPSILSYYKVKKNLYDLLTIKNRVNNTPPNIEVVDMRLELEQGNRSIFSNILVNEIKNNLQNKLQTILFLNRRGYSSFISCRKCGYIMMCENCSVNYTYHSYNNKLLCHYCNKSVEYPKICPECKTNYIKHFGIGTQKVESEIKKIVPKAKVLRMDLDTTSKKHSHENILNEFSSGNADILIGTQMIAKGHDFPKVSLVGVICADLSLNSGDFHSSENCFQLLTQVSGRAGRADFLGNVYIQTYESNHYSLECVKNASYTDFYKKEIKFREEMFYPPFSNIFSIMFCGENEESVINNLNRLLKIFNYFNQKTNFDILGPAPAIVHKIKKQYRWKIIIKGLEEERLKKFVIYCLDKLKENSDLKGINISLSLNPNYIQ